MTTKYMKSTIAKAIERVVMGEPPTRVSQDIGASNARVSVWMTKYYFNKLGTEIITKQSRMNDDQQAA